MNMTDKLATALRALLTDYGYAASTENKPARDARTTLAEYEATPRAYLPADFIREKLERYDAEIADGTVSYAFYAGTFSEIARGMLGRVS